MPRPPIEDARDRLLSAALNLFARRGTERVNSNAIARRARLGIGTFYTHFPDKHALLREIQIRTVSGLRAARVDALRGAGVRPVDQVRASVGAAIDFASSHAEAYRVTFGRERAGAAAHGPVVTESSRPTAEALGRLQSAGRLDAALDVDLAARAYSAMEVGTILWWLEDSNRAARDALADTLARMHPAAAAS
ncbi:MAG: helix-turn-helix domain-containing protein [Myxococcota bacterium]|jgi:AcrR family transcriptional regulator